MIQLKETFQKEKEDETQALIRKHEAQIAEFESKIRDGQGKNKEEELTSMIEKLNADHSQELDR